MKITTILKPVISLAFLISILTGCAHTNSHVKTPEPETPFVVITEVDTAGADTLQSTETGSISVDQMLAEAEYLCAEKRFPEADSLLRSVVKVIGNPDADWLPDSGYLDAVIAIYTDLMPQEMSIPEEISIMVFQRDMFKSLDSIKFSPNDSAELAKLICRKDIVYEVPVIWNERVQRSLYYYLNNNKEAMNRWLSRANRYLPCMKKIFSDSGLPSDLAYLPLIESGFNPRAYSHAHASGIWQFIASTGKIYGLRNNYWLDERRDPLKATVAAIQYLKKLYNEFGDWHLALAAYNCGEGGLGRAMVRCSTSNYWELSLAKETMNYVPLYLAALTIAKNPECFGYSVSSPDSFYFDTVRVSECLDLKDIAQGIGVPFDTLEEMNPHILHWCTPPDMSDVLLYLPAGKSEVFTKFYEEFPDEKKVTWYRYRIRSGDNLGTIARRFKVPMEPIKSVNRLKNNRIVAGKYLFIPIPANSSSKAFAEAEEKKNRNTSPPAQQAIPEGGIRYKVKQGDTVWRLSELFDATPEEICRWNNLSQKSRIRAGQVLKINRSSSSVSEDHGNEQNESGKYMVQRGDTPSSIALKFKMSVEELVQLNNLDKNSPVIYAGESLAVNQDTNVPVENVSHKGSVKSNEFIKYAVSIGDNLYRIAENFSVPLESILAINSINRNSILRAGDTLLIPGPEKKNDEQSGEQVVFYKIKQGDNLWSIANSFGIPVNKLYEFNNLSADSVLMPGDVIKIVKVSEK